MKILNKLTLKNLRLNKSRTIVTIIGIMLSAALITVVSGMAFSAQQTLIDAQIKSKGDYEILYSYDSDDVEEAEKIKSNRNVANVYLQTDIGIAKLEDCKNIKKPYVSVSAFSQNALMDCFKVTLAMGRFPENDSELLLSDSFVSNSGKSYSVGDTITMELGKRYSEEYDVEIPKESYYGEAYDREGNSIKTDEKLIPEQTKTYTVVGIADKSLSSFLSDENTACSNAYTFTEGKNAKNTVFSYIDLKPECEKDVLKVASQIIGVDEDIVNRYSYGELTEEEYEQYHDDLLSIVINKSQLQYKGYLPASDNTMSTIYWLAGIIIAIVIIASVFVIRNSFAISITEKTKLYGMLASVGATRKQIRHNVLFEGFCLGLIGIPLGLLLGVGVIAALITILNLLLIDALNGITFIYIMPVIPMTFAVILSAVVILLSSLSSAIRASKISPVEAIRSNKDVKLKRKQKKYNCPKLVKKIFGVGGEIAYKNLKRSKKKYRTTIISIVVSSALFISISAFVDYGKKYTGEFYNEQPYNICVGDYYSNTNSYSEIMSYFNKINKLDGIKDSFYKIDCDYNAYIEKDRLIDSPNTEDFCIKLDGGKAEIQISLTALDDHTYNKVLKELDCNYDDIWNKAIVYDVYRSKNNGVSKYYNLYNYTGGEKIELKSTFNENEKNESLTIEIGKMVNKKSDLLDSLYIPNNSFIVSKSFIESQTLYRPSYYMFVQAGNPDQTEQEITELNMPDFSVYNNDRTARQFNSLILVFEIFIYGFIAVISLIGITNIFNTITTNMRLRSKEFAMLKSIGMTRKEFNRMIRLESLFYGAKSLLFGIPLGLLGAFGIFYAFSQSVVYDYVIPWGAILISVVFVFAIVWLIMKFSISKVRKQNIIETIRNDNI